MADEIVDRLRAAGCVFADDEAALIRRLLHDEDAIDRAVAARESGMPLEQAIGRAEFAGVVIEVSDGVFVPRARAASIVDEAVRLAPAATVVVDLGCGSGALAAALTDRLPDAEVHAVDNSPDAIAVACRNGETFGFSVGEGSWWSGLPATVRGRVDLAVAYLPHVPSDRVAGIHPDFLAHEPRSAVDGGPDGLDHLRTVLSDLPSWLSPGGVFVTLIAAEQFASGAFLKSSGVFSGPTRRVGPENTPLAGWGAGLVVEGREVGDDDVVLAVRVAGSEA